MIFGKHKRQLKDLQVQNDKLQNELKTIKEKLPQIQQLMMVVMDLQSTGAGIVELRRVKPGSVFEMSSL